jgi:hypothetical protein
MLSGAAAAFSVAVAAVVFFGIGEGDWLLLVPVVACAAAALWPTRLVVAVAMFATAAVVVLDINGSGVLFGASVTALMLALNNLQAAATRVRPRRPKATV